MVDLNACLRGDQGAWEAFVDCAAPLIHSAVQRTLRRYKPTWSRHEVEDLAQDVFVRLVRDGCRLLASYDATRASLSTGLTLVARSTTIDHLRRKRLPTVPLGDADVPATASATDRGGSIGIEVPAGLLSARQELVVELLFERGLTVEEAAATLGVEPQTIRSTKHKAMVKLRKLLGGKPGS